MAWAFDALLHNYLAAQGGKIKTTVPLPHYVQSCSAPF